MAELLLSNLKVTNVHAILSQHIRVLYRRIISRSTSCKTFPATLLYSMASSVCFYIPVYLIKLLGAVDRELEVSDNIQFTSFVATTAAFYFGAVVPTYAVFIRVAASA